VQIAGIAASCYSYLPFHGRVKLIDESDLGPDESLLKGVDEPEIFPEDLYLLPLTRRPFFPGMAAPLVIEPGVYYDVLKKNAKSEDKLLGLFLTKEEDANIYDIKVSDLHKVGIVARVLRIIPLEQGGGAQVVLNMEKRVKIKKTMRGKQLRAKVEYHDDKL